MKKYKFGDDYRLYDIELIEKLYNTRIRGIPLSFWLLDLKKTKGFCHITSDFLTYCMEDSIRVEGNIDAVIGSDKSHSWVEKNNLVYDTTDGLVWKKTSYYEEFKPTNCIEYSNEQVLEEISKYLQNDEDLNEMYIAWIIDLTDHINQAPYYKEALQNHILRFKKEKDLDKKEINQSLIKAYLNEMKKIYASVDKLIEDAKIEEDEFER